MADDWIVNGVTQTVDEIQSPTEDAILIGAGAGNTGALVVGSSGSLTLNTSDSAPARSRIEIGNGGDGTLDIAGGVITFNIAARTPPASTSAGRLWIGGGTTNPDSSSGGYGTLNMSGGQLQYIAPEGGVSGNYGGLAIGRGTGVTGVFNHSGGGVSFQSGGAIDIGILGGNGLYALSGNASLDGVEGVTMFIGSRTDGSVASSGTLHISDNATITLGNGANGSAQLYVGDSRASGAVIQDGDGSVVSLSMNLPIQFGTNVNGTGGPDGGGTGSYTLNAGTLNVERLDVGSNQLIFGAANNAHGAFNIAGGTARIGADLILGSVSGATGGINQTGGTLSLVDGAKLKFGPGIASYDLSGGELRIGGANAISGNGRLTLGDATLTVQETDFSAGVDATLAEGTAFTIDTQNLNATWSGALSGDGALNKSGRGTLTLSGNNSYTGGTVLGAGILSLGANNALGTGLLAVRGGVVDYADGIDIGNTITLQADGLLNVGVGTATQSGSIHEYGGSYGITKTGGGTLVVSGPGDYSGVTTVAVGELRLGAAGILPNGTSLYVASGATFNLAGYDQSVGSLSGAGTIETGTGALTVGGDNADTAFSGTVTHTGNGWDASYGTLTKTGSGALTLNGATIANGETYIEQGAVAVTGGAPTTISYLAVGTGMSDGSPALPNEGRLDVTGGTLVVTTALQVGDWGGIGTVNQSGGIVRTEAGCGDISHCAALNIGNQGGTGTYNISGGLLEINGGNNVVGRNTAGKPKSTGTLNISDSGLVVIQNNGKLILGDNSAAGGQEGTGTINQTGGILRVANDSSLYLSAYGDGTYNLYGGTLQIGGSNSLFGNYNSTGGSPTFRLGGGTIQVYDSNLNASANAILLADTTSTFDTNGFDARWSGVLSGGGSLRKIGNGTMTLSGVNTYSGATIVSAGALATGVSGALPGMSAVSISTGALLDLANYNQTIGSLAGGGDVALGAATLDVGGNGADTVFSGTISGSGNLVKSGSGVLVLSGVNVYGGTTSIDSGTLYAGVANALPSGTAVNVAAGSTFNLGGFDQSTGAVTNSGSIIGGGNSTWYVDGAVEFKPGSHYAVTLSGPTQSDRIVASGAAMLDGAVSVRANTFDATRRYTILSADSISGRFSDTVDSNLAFVTPALDYDAHDVTLGFVSNGRSFSSVARTRNQAATADALQRLGSGSRIHDAVLGLDADMARSAFDMSSGEMHATVKNSLSTQTQILSNAILDRLSQGEARNSSGQASVPGTEMALAYDGTGGAARNDRRRSLNQSRENSAMAAWGRAIGSWAQTSATENSAATRATTGGFVAGVDTTVDSTYRFGIAAGYGRTSISVDARASSATADSYSASAYGGMQLDTFALRGGAAFTWNEIDSRRRVVFPGFNDSLSARYKSMNTQMFGEVSRRFSAQSGMLEPFAGLSYVNTVTPGFGESGGAAALTALRSVQNIGFFFTGVRMATRLPLAGIPASLHGSLRWRNAFGDVSASTSLAFAGGTSFDVIGTQIATNAFQFGAGMALSLAENQSIDFDYFGETSRYSTANSVRGTYTYRY